MLKKLLSITFVCATSFAFGQSFDSNYRFVQSGNVVQDKNFYLLTLLQKVKSLHAEAANSVTGQSLLQVKLSAIKACVTQNKPISVLIENVKFSSTDVQKAVKSIIDLTNQNPAFKEILIKHMKASGYFILYDKEPDSVLIRKSVVNATDGINGILNTYGLGIKGRFEAIDAPTIAVTTDGFRDSLHRELKAEALKSNQLFFEPSLKVAMYLLQLNKCDQPGYFEPLKSGENKKAVVEMANIKWSDYAYAAQLVPGNGPQGEERISKTGIERLKVAVENYHKNLAPFIIVSGGNVHPFRTKYNEGFEMKTELMNEFHIPESAIILEPHARHTTTNLRDCNRIFYRYHFPTDKKILISTDKKQASRIVDPEFVTRCKTEIQHVPFTNLKSLSANEIEYVPVQTSLFMDSTDPLDP